MENPIFEIKKEDNVTTSGSAKVFSELPQITNTTDTLNIMTLEELEKLAITNAIERNRGNLSNVVRELGIGRTTLYRKLKQYEINV